MEKISLSPERTTLGNLILVNQNHPVRPALRERISLVPACTGHPEVQLDRRAAVMLSHLIDHVSARGEIVPVSGWRSRREQEQIWADSLRQNGQSFTEKYVARPNCSEHQTGLAIDLAENAREIDFIRPNFPYQGICARFRACAPRYGFVERYPQGKEEVTAIAHEPWHFRYVGWPHAAIMTSRGLCLEEYVQLLEQRHPQESPLYFEQEGQQVKIFFAYASQGTVYLPEDTCHQISGTNTGGYIFTVWRLRHVS
jgi:D-alanyl-D-alanine dipeptidase/carboxypeptidase